ncbi:hypothetical protein TGRUB_234260 [Toxoplasma gondii RUB]|uniref:Uncharacterized protein n=1 Tax=Toxoplasma gondii RUB TaxID=935652 RepID=A0A086LN75_TOXGO|nr:hypothetical protein TGRUB_234260 [Toxoplasma gondii RUB]
MAAQLGCELASPPLARKQTKTAEESPADSSEKRQIYLQSHQADKAGPDAQSPRQVPPSWRRAPAAARKDERARAVIWHWEAVLESEVSNARLTGSSRRNAGFSDHEYE